MGKKDKRKKYLKDRTKHGVWAILFFILAVFFLLSALGDAGPAGLAARNVLEKGFGWGYFLFPLLSAMLGWSFLRAERFKVAKIRLIGGGLFLISGLGILNLVGTPRGGMAGELVSWPFVKLFAETVSVVVLFGLGFISLLLIFDTHFSLERKLFGWEIGRKKEPETGAESDVEVAGEDLETSKNNLEGRPPETTKTDLEGDPPENDEEDWEPKINLPRPSRPVATKNPGPFTPPPLELLSGDSGKPGTGDIKANSNIIKRTLATFGVLVEMDEVSIGPSVTRYALKPAEGVKLSRIVALQNDLALALAAHPIRIEAPIPGRSLVGVEIPNSQKTVVGLATLIGDKEFISSTTPLLLSIGRGVSGTPYYSDLGKAPHLLIAGATGSGKSVVIHALLTSLLYRNPPELLQLILIDPKRVELTLYNKLPHLLTPVITDPKKAIVVLKRAIQEMERRYEVLESHAVRDIGSYHLERGEGDEVMPYWVIVIDELADIMSTYPRELEATIVRLAQMSRAVGIHLVLSTQRPSVEVITGLIKANIPSRVALQVASQIDSRTILDMAGAEKLLGAGDLLYLSGDRGKPVRLQSPYITEKEVKAVVKWLAEHQEPVGPGLDLGIEADKDVLFASELDDGEDDDLYDEAVNLIINKLERASASNLQRRFKIGFNRASRLLDTMEKKGIVGPSNGAKPREVYLNKKADLPVGSQADLEPDAEDNLPNQS